MPYELIKMLSMMFKVDEDIINDSSCELNDSTISMLRELSKLSNEEQLSYLASGILEEGESVNYRSIRCVKERIRKDMHELNEQ